MQFTIAWPWPENTWASDEVFTIGSTFRVNLPLIGGHDLSASGHLVKAENQPDERCTLLTIEIEEEPSSRYAAFDLRDALLGREP